MNLHVLTCAVYPSLEIAKSRMWIFLRSCEKFGVTPNFYGVGATFPGYRALKLDMQYEYLKTIPEDVTHVLYTDSMDAFFVRPLTDIVAEYADMGSPSILSAAYYGLANESHEEKNYPGCFDKSIQYRYPHVGGYFAERQAITEAFGRMLQLPRQTGDDCFSHYDAWQEGWYRPMLDSDCRIFQSSAERIGIREGQLYNEDTR